jgi:hypothetical protein
MSSNPYPAIFELALQKIVDAAADEPIVLPPLAKKAKIEVEDKDHIRYRQGIARISFARNKLIEAQKSLEDAEISFAKTYFHNQITSCDSDSFDKIVRLTIEFEQEKNRIYKSGRFGPIDTMTAPMIRLKFPYEK